MGFDNGTSSAIITQPSYPPMGYDNGTSSAIITQPSYPSMGMGFDNGISSSIVTQPSYPTMMDNNQMHTTHIISDGSQSYPSGGVSSTTVTYN